MEFFQFPSYREKRKNSILAYKFTKAFSVSNAFYLYDYSVTTVWVFISLFVPVQGVTLILEGIETRGHTEQL